MSKEVGDSETDVDAESFVSKEEKRKEEPTFVDEGAEARIKKKQKL